jgi:putative zinc finger protein
MNDHPEELLAEYVEGSLEADDRARVEAHLASCSVCSEEVAMAGEARTVLTALPEVPVPFGTEQRILQRTQRRARWESPFAWKAARVAAVAAAVVGVGTAIFLGATRNADERSPFSVAPESRRAVGGEEGGAPAAAPAEDKATAQGSAATFSLYTRSNNNYTTATLTSVVRRFSAEARSALNEGFPPTARAFYGQNSLQLLVEPAQKALECVNTGVPPDRTVVPFVIESAKFENRPAYLVVYLRGRDADARYDRIQVVVVDRESCGVLHFARQNL